MPTIYPTGTTANDIQTALNQAVAGDVVKLQPSVQYTQEKILFLNRAGFTFDLSGAKLHSLDPDNGAIILRANGIRLVGDKNTDLTSAATERGTTPAHHRIAAYWENENGMQPLDDIRISGVTIHGGAAAGIFLYRCSNFVVENNAVVRTYADGIHMTGGSSFGRVTGNVVRENGDDMVAVVSYAPGDPCHHIVVEGNDLARNYHGRGATVVGGEYVTIRNNRIDSTVAAALYVAREPKTLGVYRVLLEGNKITENQTKKPVWNPGGKWTAHAGHGAVHLYVGLNEGDDPQQFKVLGVTQRDNTFGKIGYGAFKVTRDGPTRGLIKDLAWE